MRRTTIISTCVVVLSLAVVTTLHVCTVKNENISKTEIDSLRNQIKQMTANETMIAKNLQTMDTLDFTVFSNQEWTRLHESQAKDIKVFWPDGHVTTGIKKHIEDLRAMLVHAPDTRYKQHPIRFGSGNMTAVTGVMEGTFTKLMPLGNGKFIRPTGKAFRLSMCTIGILGA